MRKLVAKPTFHYAKEFSEDLAAVNMMRERLVLKKPVYTGFAVLDLSKVLMYSFHYEYMLPKYGVKRLILLSTDTDSLCYDIQTEDFYRDIAGDIEAKFDTADYPSDHPLYSTVHKKVIGMMKDETAGNPVREFVGLRSKMITM